MSTGSKPDHQDDLIRLIRILADGPMAGLSIEMIQGMTTATGETWSFRTINSLLCDLGNSRVKHEKIRTKSGKVTMYQLRSTN